MGCRRRPRACRTVRHGDHGPATPSSSPPEPGPWSVCPAPRVPGAGPRAHSTADSPCGRRWRARRPTPAAIPVRGCRRVRGRGSIRHPRVLIGNRDIGDCRRARAGRPQVPNGSGGPTRRGGRGTRTVVISRCSGCDVRRRITGVRLRASLPGSPLQASPPGAGSERAGVAALRTDPLRLAAGSTTRGRVSRPRPRMPRGRERAGRPSPREVTRGIR